MDQLDQYREIVQRILTNYDEMTNRSSLKKYETCLIFDVDHDHYLWKSLAWVQGTRINNTHVYVRIINHKIYIEEDFTEEGIAADLLRAGIPKEDIVLAFHDPETRRLTDFSVA